jgi:hypothetical protein
MQRESADDDDSVAMPEREALATPARLAPRRRLLVRLGIATATVALLGVALALAHVPLPPLTSLFPSSFSPPNGWQRYADPDQSFRVWIPPDWTSQLSEAAQVEGLCQPGSGDCFVYQQESVLLGSTPQDPTTFAIQISVDPIATSTARDWWCRVGTPTPNTQVGGVPSTRRQASDGHPVWEIFTSTAHFAVQPFGAHSAAEAQATDTVVASFTPGAPYPMRCP